MGLYKEKRAVRACTHFKFIPVQIPDYQELLLLIINQLMLGEKFPIGIFKLLKMYIILRATESSRQFPTIPFTSSY